MFTQTSEYALRAVAWLAAHPEEIYTTGEIAAGTQVPTSYLSKVLQTLARAGIVRSQRGLGGGFSLARPIAELTVLEVLAAVDPLPRIERCPLGVPCHERELCKLHSRLDAAMQLVEDCLREATIESLITEAPESCAFGRVLPEIAKEREDSRDES